jgi:hypothetical protein
VSLTASATVAACAAQPKPHSPARLGELDGVRQQVEQDLLQLVRIRAHGERRAARP